MKNIDEIIKTLNLEQKVSLCTGADYWSTKEFLELGVPSIFVADGPHGLRKSLEGDNTGIAKGIEATCFPTASALSSSWNIELLYEVGKALGEECRAMGVDILLGPGINMKRSPLCGRNFEYFSEDPCLTGEIGKAFVLGVQGQGVGTCVKHFACNNEEFERLTISSEVDKRALREIYLSAFERIVKEAKPWSIMSAYNRVNGVYASENEYLLKNILREEWGFNGIVISDWGAVNDKVKSINAGLDIEMPGPNPYNDKKLIKAVKNNELDESVLDETVKRILDIVFKAVENRKGGEMKLLEHHKLARRAACESIVLLKNDDNILPLKRERISCIAVIGQTAKKPRYQGAGSSKVTPATIDNPFDEIKRKAGDKIDVLYSIGYPDSDEIEENIIEDALNISKGADAVLLFLGLPERMETEGADREHIDIPKNQIRLIKRISEIQKNIIVILSNGSAISMTPWIDDVKGVLETWLTGQASGGAISDIIFGDVNPSGKLSETFPAKLSDNPSYLNFPGENGKVIYGEGIFTGYRYYDYKEVEPLFPFGFGLSYTTFEYSNIKLSSEKITDKDSLKVYVTIKNTGNKAGAEIVELYIRDVESRLIRPYKELKAFSKVYLSPKESKIVELKLNPKDFSYYDLSKESWVIESGYFDIMVGSSSRDIHLTKRIYMESNIKYRTKLTKYSTLREWTKDTVGIKVLRKYLKGYLDEILNPDAEYYEMKMSIPLYKIMFLSEGQICDEIINSMVEEAN